jgi:hypothetical protein
MEAFPRQFPKEIIADTDTKAVTITPDIEATLPGIRGAFTTVDRVFLDNPDRHLRSLEESLFTFRSSEGKQVACSLLFKADSVPDELLVLLAPFSDRDPKSTADKLSYFIFRAAKEPSLITKERAAPNTWNQITKSADAFELLTALGKNIPVLTIFSPIPTGAYSSAERRMLKNGYFDASTRLIEEGIAEAQIRLHGKGSGTQLDKLHLGGASLGGNNALGSGWGLAEQGKNVLTVTTQELVTGIPLGKLAVGYTIKKYTHEPSSESVSARHPSEEESAIRKKIDQYGSELIGTNARMLKGMKPTYLRGFKNSAPSIVAAGQLTDNGTNVLMAYAENSSITQASLEAFGWLNGSHGRLLELRGRNGKKLGHIVNEFVRLSSLVTALNVASQRSNLSDN